MLCITRTGRASNEETNTKRAIIFKIRTIQLKKIDLKIWTHRGGELVAHPPDEIVGIDYRIQNGSHTRGCYPLLKRRVYRSIFTHFCRLAEKKLRHAFLMSVLVKV